MRWNFIPASLLSALHSVRPHPRMGEQRDMTDLDAKLAAAKEWMKERGIEPALVHRKRRKTDVETTKEDT